MRVLLLANSYPPVLGGLQVAVHGLARQLVQRGHAVQVVTQRYPLSLPACHWLEGVRVQRWHWLMPEARYVRQGRLDLFCAGLALAPQTLLRLVRLTQSFRPDVVNLHFPSAQVAHVLQLRRLFHFRLVISLHGHDVQRWAGAAAASTDFAAWRRLLRQADAVTACSQALLAAAIALEPALEHHGQVIYNGLDLHEAAAASPFLHPRPFCLAYGRLTHAKGFDLLLEALAALNRQQSLPVDLILAGAGEAQPALEAQARVLGLTDRVVFFGRASRAQIASLLRGSCFVVVPSRQEAFGYVVLEALAAGVPVLATHVGGIPEIVRAVFPETVVAIPAGRATALPGPGGQRPVGLVEPSVEALTQALAGWLPTACAPPLGPLKHPPGLQTFSWAHMAAAYERVLEGD